MNSRWLLTTCVGLGLVGTTFAVARADEHEDHTEQKVEFAKAPEAVQKTFTDEAQGAKIDTVCKEDHKGKTRYEADVTIDSKAYEIKVAEDGTLISKKLDDGDHDKKDKDHDKDKDHEKDHDKD